MTQSQTTETYRPNVIKLESCVLLNHKGKELDIRDVVLEVSIYHDIYNKGIRCELFVIDSNGLIELVPIIGNETFYISFTTPTEKRTLKYIFQIYSITDRKKFEQRAEGYVIHGASHEIINNERKVIDKSYANLPISTVIKRIYNNFLKPNDSEAIIEKRERELIISDTLNSTSVIFNGKKPYDAIDYLCTEAISKNELSKSSNFVFFQRENGWYFQTFDSLLTAKAVDDFYFHEASAEQENTVTGEKIHDYQKINNLDFVNQFNTLKNINAGLYSNKIKSIDPILKKFTTDNFLYSRDFSKMSHIEQDKKSFDSSYLIADDSFLIKDAGTPAEYYILSNIGENYNQLSYLRNAVETDSQIKNPRLLHKKMKYDLASRIKLNNIVLNVAVPGNVNLEIGQIVNIHILQSTQNEDFLKKENLLYGNRFLITTIRHTYQKEDNVFFTLFECVKDTYAQKAIEVE